MDFDAAISLGGQSLLDGIWRLLGPALAPLGSPIPLAVPGMSGATAKVLSLEPRLAFDSRAGRPYLAVDVTYALAGDVVLAGLGGPDLAIRLPQNLGTASLPLRVPIELPAAAAVLGLRRVKNPKTKKITKVVTALSVRVHMPMRVRDPLDAHSASSLVIDFLEATIDPKKTLPVAIDQLEESLREQLGRILPVLLGAPPGKVAALLSSPDLNLGGLLKDVARAVPKVAGEAIADALSNVGVRTGRLVWPVPQGPLFCEQSVAPGAANARFALVQGTGRGPEAVILQIGFFYRSRDGFGDPVPSDPDYPDFSPSAAAEAQIDVGIVPFVGLLACLIEQLPAFTFQAGAGKPVVKTSGHKQVVTCTWAGVRMNLPPLALGGGKLVLEVSGSPKGEKTIKLEAWFTEVVRVPPGLPNTGTSIVSVNLHFALNLDVKLSGTATLSALKLSWPQVWVKPSLRPGDIFIQGDIFGELARGLLGPFGGGNPLPVVHLLAALACMVLEHHLTNAVPMALKGGRHGLESAAAIPAGIFEAFGQLVPLSVRIDDLRASGILATPGTDWGLRLIDVPKLPKGAVPPPIS